MLERALPFIYESTGAETRFTNGYDRDAHRRVFTFHRPEVLAERLRQIRENPEVRRSGPG
jgi:type I restriction enzyme R subunit